MEFLQEPEFWVAVGFVMLVGVFLWVKLPAKVAASLDDRAALIKVELDEAERLRNDAQKLLADYQTKQREALAEAEGILRQAEQEAVRNRELGMADLEASLKRREQQAMDRIAQAELKAVDEVRTLAVDLAVAATRKLIEDNLDGTRANQLVDQAIAELPQKLH